MLVGIRIVLIEFLGDCMGGRVDLGTSQLGSCTVLVDSAESALSRPYTSTI